MKPSNELTNSQFAHTQNSLAHAWIDLFRMPDDSTMTAFIQTLYSHLEWKQMEFSNQNGQRKISNPDVSLMAVVKIASSLLTGNESLMLATNIHFSTRQCRLYRTQAAVLEDIADQLDLCCNAGLKYAVREIRRARIRKRENAEKIQQTLIEIDVAQAAQERRNVRYLSMEDKIKILKKALTKAMNEGKITLGSAELVLLVIRDGKPQAEIAKLKKISRAAVSQRLSAVAEKLKPIVAASEWS